MKLGDGLKKHYLNVTLNIMVENPQCFLIVRALGKYYSHLSDSDVKFAITNALIDSGVSFVFNSFWKNLMVCMDGMELEEYTEKLYMSAPKNTIIEFFGGNHNNLEQELLKKYFSYENTKV